MGRSIGVGRGTGAGDGLLYSVWHLGHWVCGRLANNKDELYRYTGCSGVPIACKTIQPSGRDWKRTSQLALGGGILPHLERGGITRPLLNVLPRGSSPPSCVHDSSSSDNSGLRGGDNENSSLRIYSAVALSDSPGKESGGSVRSSQNTPRAADTSYMVWPMSRTTGTWKSTADIPLCDGYMSSINPSALYAHQPLSDEQQLSSNNTSSAPGS